MRPESRPGYSLIELVVVLAVVAVLLGLSVPRVGGAADRTATRAAARELMSAFAAARDYAIARRTGVAVMLDSVGGTVTIAASGQVLSARQLRLLYGVRLSTSRDSMAFDARGVGRGAANLRVVVRRGGASDTVSLSRLGRVRRSGALVSGG